MKERMKEPYEKGVAIRSAPSLALLPRECGWKHGDSGYSAGEKTFVHKKQQRIDLTPTGLLMEGVSATLRLLFAR